VLEWLPHIDKKWRRIIRLLLNDDPQSRPENARALNRALADVDPNDWLCQMGDNGITWTRTGGRRRIVVTLEKHGARSVSWNAISYPVGKGRQHTLAASGRMGYRQAEKELREFFG
jgi:hypothetical protein